MRNLFSAVATAIAAQVFCYAAPAAAQGDAIATLPTQVVRTDVRSACPGIDQALQASLAKAVRLAPADGLVHVKFTLEGNAVSHVHVDKDNFAEFGRTVRWAVGDLGCTAHASGTQEFAFSLHFSDTDAPGQERVALVD